MRPDCDPAHLSTGDRFAELATLLARGLLRLRDKAALTPAVTSAPQIVLESVDSAVAVPPAAWPHVHTG